MRVSRDTVKMAQFSSTAEPPLNSGCTRSHSCVLKPRQGRGQQKASCSDAQLALHEQRVAETCARFPEREREREREREYKNKEKKEKREGRNDGQKNQREKRQEKGTSGVKKRGKKGDVRWCGHGEGEEKGKRRGRKKEGKGFAEPGDPTS